MERCVAGGYPTQLPPRVHQLCHCIAKKRHSPFNYASYAYGSSIGGGDTHWYTAQYYFDGHVYESVGQDISFDVDDMGSSRYLFYHWSGGIWPLAQKETMKESRNNRNYFRRLGAWRNIEKRVVLVFCLTALLWMTRKHLGHLSSICRR